MKTWPFIEEKANELLSFEHTDSEQSRLPARSENRILE